MRRLSEYWCWKLSFSTRDEEILAEGLDCSMRDWCVLQKRLGFAFFFLAIERCLFVIRYLRWDRT